MRDLSYPAIQQQLPLGTSLEVAEYYHECQLKHSLVNCWRVGAEGGYSESAVFWDAYVPDGMGVAIGTTLGQLREQLVPFGKKLNKEMDRQFETSLMIGEVNYIDFEVAHITYPFPSRLFFKRDAFTEEREFRIAANTFDFQVLRELMFAGDGTGGHDFPPGRYVDIDSSALINDIYLSPSAPGYLLENLRGLVGKYCCLSEGDLHPSALSGQPRY